MSKTVLQALACLVCLMLAAVSCSGAASVNSGPVAAPQVQLSPAPAAEVETGPVRSISLEAAVADLRDLETPPGVDPALFAELKSAFEQVLNRLYAADGTPAGKAMSALKVEQMCQAWVTDARIKGGGEVELKWLGRHSGDYDLNSEVNVSDLTPLGLFFMKTADYDAEGMPMSSGDNERRCQVDGDDNAEINISDLTTIGLNFNSKLVGYRVYPGYSADGAEFTWEADYIEGPDGPGPVSVPFNTSTKAGELLHYSLTFAKPEVPGGSTLYAKIVPFDGTGEGMEQIMAVYDGPHSSQFCSMCHSKVERTFLGETDSCRMCHASPSGGGEWDSAPLLHQTCTNCHTQHEFTIAEMGPVCSTCHGSISTQLEASGMNQCTDCHVTPHVPKAHPATADCAGCHADEAAGIADEAMPNCSTCHSQHTFVQTYEPAACTGCHAHPDDNASADWASAPGLHGTCASCHELHNFSMDEPNSTCADCHEAVISGGHAEGNTDCLGCHGSPHVPQNIDFSDCTKCHPVPPENPAASWDDAPGLHDQCLNCHPGDHPDKPVPAERDCLNCHADGWDLVHQPTDTECLTCHTYPHLPEFTLTSDDCQGCHTDYTGDGNHEGSCLDCHQTGDHPPTDGWDHCFDCHS